MLCPKCGSHINGDLIAKNGNTYVSWICDCGYNPINETLQSALERTESNLNESLKELELIKLRNALSNNPDYLC